MMERGYIYLERRIREHWLWNDKPFSMGQAWIDLILSANHEDREIVWNGSKVTVKRGQLITSISKLAEKWGWNRKKVRRFLNVLEMDNSLSVNVTAHGTTVTLVKYSFFQNKRTAKGTTKEQQNDHQRDNRGTQTRNYKELKGNKRKEPPASDAVDDDDDDGMTMEEYDRMREAEKNGAV